MLAANELVSVDASQTRCSPAPVSAMTTRPADASSATVRGYSSL